MLFRTLLSTALTFVAGMGTLRASVLLESYPLLMGGMALLGVGIWLLVRPDTRPVRRPRTV